MPGPPRDATASSSRRSPRRGGRSSTSRRSWSGSAPASAEDDLDELAALADSAGAEPVGRIVQSRREPDPQFWIGKGKVEELHRLLHAHGRRARDLRRGALARAPAVARGAAQVKVVDRTALILDIFALHAHSREGKAQVELAQLNYLLPRLRGWGEAMSRLGGGIGTRGSRRDEARVRPSAHPPADHEAPARREGPADDARHASAPAGSARTSRRSRSPATRTPGSPR